HVSLADLAVDGYRDLGHGYRSLESRYDKAAHATPRRAEMPRVHARFLLRSRLGIYTTRMRVEKIFMRSCAALACVLWLPLAASAQDDRGAVISGSVFASNMESHTDVGFGGTYGYRFSRVFGLEIEA